MVKPRDGLLGRDEVQAGATMFISTDSMFNLRASTVELLDPAGRVILSQPFNLRPWERTVAPSGSYE